MKKNNMFMLSYIIFVFIAFIVKFCWDFPMWAPIVTAITVASCIFSCADFTNIIATEYETDVKDFTPLLDTAMDKCQKIEKFFSNHKTQLEQLNTQGDELTETLLQGPEVVEEAKQQIISINNGLKLKNILSRIGNWLTAPLIVTGFLSFFCTLAFEPISMFLVPIQDYLTVLAFGIMMLTQYFGNVVKEEHINLESNYNEANSILGGINELLTQVSMILEQEGVANAN